MTGTTNLNLTKPAVGGDSDAWGGYLDTDLDTLDAMLLAVIYGLTLSAAGSTATFGIAAGAASGMALSSAYTKTASSWAVGTANGSLDTGSVANSTWYHVWLIQRSDTGVVDVLTSLSATAPTMPTNYDHKRRIGAMKTDGSAQWYAFTQTGNAFIWGAIKSDLVNTAGWLTPAVQTLSVPTGVKVVARIRGEVGTTDCFFLITSPDEGSRTANGTTGHITGSYTGGANPTGFTLDVMTNTSAQIYLSANDNTSTFYVFTYGWIDPRGQY